MRVFSCCVISVVDVKSCSPPRIAIALSSSAHCVVLRTSTHTVVVRIPRMVLLCVFRTLCCVAHSAHNVMSPLYSSAIALLTCSIQYIVSLSLSLFLPELIL